MKSKTITLEIATHNLGANTEADNAAYCAATEARLVTLFPGAAVSVALTSNGDRDVVHLDGFDDDERESAEEVCRETARAVWDAAAYATAKSWKITSGAGVDLGTYDGATREEALDAMAREAGYRNRGDAAETTGDDGAHLTVEAVARIEVELSSAVGPRVLVSREATAEQIEAALPPGWAVDWETTPAHTSWGFSHPLTDRRVWLANDLAVHSPIELCDNGKEGDPRVVLCIGTRVDGRGSEAYLATNGGPILIVGDEDSARGGTFAEAADDLGIERKELLDMLEDAGLDLADFDITSSDDDEDEDSRKIDHEYDDEEGDR